MRKPRLIAGAILAVAALASGMWSALAQAPFSTGVPVHVVVTVEPRHGSNVPVINREDVMAYQGHDRAKVTDWLPLQGEHAGLQLFILIDDTANTSLGSQLEDIRQFINAQPSTTVIGVAYMRNGIADILQNPTNDHAQAAKALRLPFGDAGASGSPYFSAVDLIKRWPEGPVRREILMVSDGIDRFGGPDPVTLMWTPPLKKRSAGASSFSRSIRLAWATMATVFGV